eukprot:CAMPEP_0196575648 /NCGR_PEP_ID=MMETSP1081-20130531/5081_1 /TAXON_ID=36882 /ORGANISM="Pyramimonas amylifera, Strain CCMP720" /LENGTH=259 /DNA_ID=CAMNT_0041894009 /DNA_START=650 /DNA_END=1429 /DNA_ORIENTATION=-
MEEALIQSTRSHRRSLDEEAKKGCWERAPASPASAGAQPLAILQEMIQTACIPPRRMFESVICTLAVQPLLFEAALRSMWLMELGPCTHAPCANVTNAIVKGALRAVSLHQEDAEMHTAATWRALGIVEALRATSGVHGESEGSLSEVIEACLRKCSSREELRRVQACVTQALQDHMRLPDTTHNALLDACERFGDRQECIDLVSMMRERGWSPNPKSLLSLYEWCVEEQDMDGAAYLEEELVKSGKAEYLISLNSQKC